MGYAWPGVVDRFLHLLRQLAFIRCRFVGILHPQSGIGAPTLGLARYRVEMAGVHLILGDANVLEIMSSPEKRTNARLKDEFGADTIFVRGDVKVVAHLMFGVLALTADQLLRLLT